MGRAVQIFKIFKQDLILTAVSLGVAIGLVASIAVAVSGSSQPAVKPVALTAAQQSLNTISYQGQNGVDALSLLKKHARVQTKHYSFGDEVISINGVAGTGPKYWTFYVNGKMSDMGASSYITKNSDALQWKLQK